MELRNDGNGTLSIYCDCCGREKLAELRAGKIIIFDRRHGKRHIAVIPIAELSAFVERDLTKKV